MGVGRTGEEWIYSQEQDKSQKYFYFEHIQRLESSWEKLCTERLVEDFKEEKRKFVIA